MVFPSHRVNLQVLCKGTFIRSVCHFLNINNNKASSSQCRGNFLSLLSHFLFLSARASSTQLGIKMHKTESLAEESALAAAPPVGRSYFAAKAACCARTHTYIRLVIWLLCKSFIHSSRPTLQQHNAHLIILSAPPAATTRGGRLLLNSF